MTVTAAYLSTVETPAAFMEILRDFHVLRGKPGSRRMAIRCGQAYTATPIASALAADTLPNLKMLRAILNGLLASPADQAAFDRAWHKLSLAAELTGG